MQFLCHFKPKRSTQYEDITCVYRDRHVSGEGKKKKEKGAVGNHITAFFFSFLYFCLVLLVFQNVWSSEGAVQSVDRKRNVWIHFPPLESIIPQLDPKGRLVIVLLAGGRDLVVVSGRFRILPSL
jgi:hypothetical protein